MDMDSASWALDALRVAAEAQTAVTATASQYSTATVADIPSLENPNLDATASFFTSTSTPPFVSQFRIDGQPILPPLMTEEKRRQMQELRKQAISVERRVSNRLLATTLDDANKEVPAFDTDSSSNSSSSSKSQSSSGGTATSQEFSTMPRRSQLQQTQTFIYDSTQEQQPQQPQQRPQTLSIGSNHVLLPTICVNPPTPLQQPPKPPPFPAICPTVESMCNRKLTSARRKLNKITSRIMQFEQTGLGGLIPEQEPIELLWQNQTLLTPLAEKRAMQRSSTSPALHAGHEQEQQMQRSRSFTLEQPSQALVEHMQRVANETASTTMAMPPPPPLPPPPPPPPSRAAQPPLEAKTSSPRCHFNTSCNSVKGLSSLRRDTVESKAKQVQRVASSTSTMTSRRSGGHTPGRLQQQQQQIRELLQRALHETTDVMEEQDVEKRRQLTVAKQKMLKDIKSAHRDRFQQLVQYQLEEQRRMQAEFDRQQKLLIEQICADINVSTYAMEQPVSAGGKLLTNGKSEYTSTDDLPSLSTKSETQSEEELQLLHANELAASTARKRLFEEAERERMRESHEALLDLSLESLPSTSSPKSRVRKPAQRNVSKAPGKLTPPPVNSRMSRPKTPANANSNSTSTGTGKRTPQKSRAASPTKSGKQTNLLNRQRQSVSSSRQTAMPEATIEHQRRRHEAATILTAATRGFLVRRLFRTEQVQRIVQTIRDTLIFVLNLHLETFGGVNMGQQQEEAANIRLKARLLQQLCSASRTLHLIFFQTSIRERMEIIARDRKRIKTKLLSMHVKQRQ